MARRIKNPTIKPGQRLDWLKRSDAGESPPKIAQADGVDVRTVRSHLEKARLEQDLKQARSEVLRSALEGHYRDLMDTAKTIETRVLKEVPIDLENAHPLVSGLHQHMPRSSIWGNLRKWNVVLADLKHSEEALGLQLRELLATEQRLVGISSEGAGDVPSAIVAVLMHQASAWARGGEGLSLERDFHIEPAERGKVQIKYGFSHFGETDKKHAETLKAVIADCESALKGIPEYQEMQKLYSRLRRIKKSLLDEITVILLRRIVTGKCKYCPL